MFLALKLSVAVIIIGALIIPVGLFGSSAEAGSKMTQSNGDISGKPSLSVVMSPALTSVTSGVPARDSCNFGSIVQSNLVQDTGLINFNQPADCFTIGSAKLSLPEQLAVTSAANNMTVSVENRQVTSWIEFQPVVALPLAAPAMPALTLTLLIPVGVLAIGLMRKKWSGKIVNFSQVLSLSQLQVRRC